MSSFRLSFVLALVYGFLPSRLVAQTAYQWNNTGADWGTNANWTPSGFPGTFTNDIGVLSSGGAFGATIVNNPSVGAQFEFQTLRIGNSFSGGGWTFSGAAGNFTLASNGAGGGVITRGNGSYIFDGPIIRGQTATNVADIELGAGSTMVLAGNSSANQNVRNILFQGGNLTLDNTTTNLVGGNRVSVTTDFRALGGGTLTLLGNQAGSALSVGGQLEIGRGDLTVKIVTPASPTGGSSLNFNDLNRADVAGVVNFSSSGPGTLGGGAANDPKITFTTAPGLVNGLIASGTARGFAIFNGESFASYDATNGVIRATETTVNGTLTTALTQNSLLNGNGNFASTVNFNSLKILPSAAGGARKDIGKATGQAGRTSSGTSRRPSGRRRGWPSAGRCRCASGRRFV